MRHILSDLMHGAILAAIAGGASCLLALVGFGRPYYLAVFLPFSALVCLSIAWFLHLREDRFFDSPSRMRAPPAGTTPERRGGGLQDADDKDSPPSQALLRGAARWDQAPLPRAAESEERGAPQAKQALLWAAAFLAVAATVLYSVWGIGAVYHT